MSTWFSSDLHMAHEKEFLYEPRGFICMEDHCEGIIENWNSVVAPADTVYLMGDSIVGQNKEYGYECLKRLNGNIFYVRGNHDTDNKCARYDELGWHCLGYATMIKYGKVHFYLSHYPTETTNFDNDKEFKARVWNLCGHKHTKDRWKDFKHGSYHVELDAHDCFPISAENIIEDIKANYKAIKADAE